METSERKRPAEGDSERTIKKTKNVNDGEPSLVPTESVEVKTSLEREIIQDGTGKEPEVDCTDEISAESELCSNSASPLETSVKSDSSGGGVENIAKDKQISNHGFNRFDKALNPETSKIKVPSMSHSQIHSEIIKLKCMGPAKMKEKQQPPTIKDETTTQDETSMTEVADEPKKGPGKYQMEVDVGITEYIGSNKPYSGILKHRFRDFIVNEITLDGEETHLTNFDIPTEPVLSKDLDFENLKNLLTEEQLKHLKELDESKRSGDLLIEAEDMPKESRKILHKSLKQQFKHLTASTDQINGRRVITVRVLSQITLDKRREWPSERPTFTHFVLYKENRDTIDAINTLAAQLHMKPGTLTYAGTKDKRGVTSQMVSVFKVEAKKLIETNERLYNMKVGNVVYKNAPLQLGDLQGNKFSIVLRELSADQETVGASLTLLAEKGFINYFGLQRFGTTSVSTQAVGKCLLLGQWKEAIDLILKPRPRDSPDMQQCRQTWSETRDAKKALSKLRRKGSIEGMLLNKISQHGPQDYINALNGLPRNMRLLYLHAYQSYIWNLVVSRRISRLGLKPVPGDLVLPSKAISEAKSKEVPNWLTQEDVDKFTIFDVMLPLPGYETIYPKNEASEWYKEILEADGLTTDSFKSTVSTYSLGGSYRHILIKPFNVSWSFLSYSNPSQDLNITDLGRIEKQTIEDLKGDHQALKLEISLPSSCYATMAIRQLTRQDTSAWSQNHLSS